MKVWALIPTAGTGERFGAAIPKPLVDLKGKPVIAHTLEVFEKNVSVDGVVLIIHPDFRKGYEKIIAEFGFKKVRAVVDGGATRTQSVRQGLSVVPLEADVVMVHDGVRPLVSEALIARGLKAVLADPAVVAAVQVKPTLKVVDPGTGRVRETLDRTLVWEIQTPQIFEYALLKRAYNDDATATDDAALVEALGFPVKTFPGDYQNIKITTTDDILVAEAFLDSHY